VRAVFFLIVAAVVLVGGGMLLGRFFETPEEASLRQPPEVVPITDPLRVEILEQTLTLRGTLAPAGRVAPRFAAGIEGKIITAVLTEPGQELASGQVLLEVQGRPVIVLTGAFPTWRDLTWPMPPGPDISQLQAALAELGFYHGDVDGRYEASTLTAVFELYRSIGYEPPSRSAVHHQEFVFIPSEVRTVERVGVAVGDTLQPDSITLATATRRIEADLTFDQRQAVEPGVTIRWADSSDAGAWSATIDRVLEIQLAEGSTGPTIAILTREPIPASMAGEQVFEVVLASTGEAVLSASPAAVHTTGDGEPFVVVLEGTDETVIPVRVGLVTDARIEVTPEVTEALKPGDQLVLNPDR
jgi:hypothetical protein